MQRARGVGTSRHEMRAEGVAVHMGAERTGPSHGPRWWRCRTVRFCELDGQADLAGKVRLGIETVEVSTPRLVGRVGGLTESETPTKIRQLRHGVQEVVRAERRSSASEPQLKFHVVSGSPGPSSRTRSVCHCVDPSTALEIATAPARLD